MGEQTEAPLAWRACTGAASASKRAWRLLLQVQSPQENSRFLRSENSFFSLTNAESQHLWRSLGPSEGSSGGAWSCWRFPPVQGSLSCHRWRSRLLVAASAVRDAGQIKWNFLEICLHRFVANQLVVFVSGVGGGQGTWVDALQDLI